MQSRDRGFMEKISQCRKAISRWKRNNKSNSAVRIQEIHHEIDMAKRANPYVHTEVTRLSKELQLEYQKEEQFWRMKSRITWLNNGDRNTRFFHAATKNRRAQNKIRKLVDDQGREWYGEKDLGRVAESYFKSLFASEGIGIQLEDTDLWHSDEAMVTQEQNSSLMAPVTRTEVRMAVFDINPTKCPGPDGMNGYFYQHLWDTIGEDLFHLIEKFFQDGQIEAEMNKTNICLIPKKSGAVKMVDFRPISLSNVAYKIIAKILAKRLKKVLPRIISDTQAAFIQGRLISDNILVAHELLHALESKNKCAEDFIAVKTDISKAFDRVEWGFLESALRIMGFSNEWIRLLMSCVTTVSYQVLINGHPHGSIIPTRGIRQGDPLSPYLFIICSEMLARMLKKAEMEERITGLKVARNAPAVTHLMFADDTMFYCRERDDELDQLRSILDKYSLASGQRINYLKSSIYFGKKIPIDRREVIKERLEIHQNGGKGRYLGLPESFGGSKVSILSYLKENLSQKVGGWQNKFLSSGGKEIMLKAVAFALPTYTMTCFLVPKTICKKIMSIIADFWWKNNNDHRGMHWKAWDQMCKSKKQGGLGFRDIKAFNLALLGKQLWRMMTHKDTLMARIFKARYFNRSTPLNAELGSRPSYAWRSIHAAQGLIRKGSRRTIGNGDEVLIWEDQWLDRKPSRPIRAANWAPNQVRPVINSISKVGDLLCNNGREWNDDLLSSIFREEDRLLLEEIRPGGLNSEDSYSWDYTRTGHYSVKSGYWVYLNVPDFKDKPREVSQPSLDHLFQLAWKTDTSPKIHHFLWKCLSNCISVAATLKQRHIAKDGRCNRCHEGDESVNHMLFQCPFARLTWAISGFPAPPRGEMSDSIYSNLYRVFTVTKRHPYAEREGKLGPWLMWRLWKNRNELVIKGKEYDAMETVKKAEEDMEEWLKRSEGVSKRLENHATKDTTQLTWKPPPEGWLKCNVDGAWSKEQNQCGIGWVLRDNRGKIIWMGARKLKSLRSSLETEIEALRWAIQVTTSFRYRNIIYETDSQEVIEAISEEEGWPIFKALARDISTMLASLERKKIIFQAREGNGVADRIAKETYSFVNYVPKVYSIMPRWIIPYVSEDILNCTNTFGE
uniref:Reverse transcriptase domain-containing protein n=1 Tax=Noccaea caerulescens TaxID=107243 RepID=A0A1J3D6G7_NOCCA